MVVVGLVRVAGVVLRASCARRQRILPKTWAKRGEIFLTFCGTTMMAVVVSLMPSRRRSCRSSAALLAVFATWLSPLRSGRTPNLLPPLSVDDDDNGDGDGDDGGDGGDDGGDDGEWTKTVASVSKRTSCSVN